MSLTRVRKLYLLILFVFLQTQHTFSQTSTYPIAEWVKKLGNKNAPVTYGVQEILDAFNKKDSTEVFAALNELEKRGGSAGKYFATRFNYLKANCVWATNFCTAKETVSYFMKKALNSAYEINDESFVSALSWRYGAIMYECREIEPAAMYCLYAAEIDQKVGIRTDADKCRLLGDILYITRDYEKSINYTRQAIERETDTSSSMKTVTMSRWNTIALCWQRMEQFDSAFFYFDIAMRMATAMKSEIWQGIISGNKGQIYFQQKKYAIAKELLVYDYHVSKEFGELASAANSLQWIARIDLIEGKKDSALMRVKEAMELLKIIPHPNYLQNVSYASADVYRAVGNNDSVYKYFQLYNYLHDSIEKSVAGSRLEISQIKLKNLQSIQAINNLNKEREAEEMKRNFILAAIIMFAVIVILILNWQKQKSSYKQQLALQQKAAAVSETEAAREQLNLFKQNVIEKTNLIEKLQEQVKFKESNEEQLKIVEELSGSTILTEEDWDKFKKLFEKIYPGFFKILKENAPDITIAEQRMAALTRLHLTAKQMASMLGISVDSVHKTRQRLRHRLQLTAEVNLEETISGL